MGLLVAGSWVEVEAARSPRHLEEGRELAGSPAEEVEPPSKTQMSVYLPGTECSYARKVAIRDRYAIDLRVHVTRNYSLLVLRMRSMKHTSGERGNNTMSWYTKFV